MINSFGKYSSFLLAPVISIGLLGGIVAENRTYLHAEDFEPFHARARAAIAGIPLMISGWNGVDTVDDVPKEAQTLLRPNIILSRRYSDASVLSITRPRVVNLLIVQCKQPSDMLGHFPPNCYPSSGREFENPRQRDGTPRNWRIGSFVIPGKEYRFINTRDGQSYRTTVYNFLIVPGQGIVRDMEGVKSAAGDYQQKYYGAAQFQVVFHGVASADLSQSERDQIFTTLMTPAVPVIQTLSTGAIQ